MLIHVPTAPEVLAAMKLTHFKQSTFIFRSAGATCPDGNIFLPVVNGSKWAVNKSTGNNLYRLIECPAGYVISQDESFPDQDRCVQCQAGTYSLIVAKSTDAACLPCPIGGNCTGGNIVQSTDGFWRRDMGRDNYSIATAQVFKCPVGIPRTNIMTL